MDENKEVISTDPKREKVRVIPLSAIDDAPDHPFGVRDDEEMAELVESISTFGVINPVIVRKGEGERYELISGHRRKYGCFFNAKQWVEESDIELAAVTSRTYDVRVQTGLYGSSGTDDDVLLTIFGTNGSTGVFRLNGYVEDEEFEKGGLNTMKLKGLDVGTITDILVKVDGGDGWYLEYVTVEGKTYPAQMWLEYSSAELKAAAVTTHYIKITTADKWLAGTDGDVYIELIGSDGQSTGKILLDEDGKNDFERNESFVYTLRNVKDVGTITKAILSLEDGDDWCVGSVSIDNGEVYTYNQWLEEGEQITINLTKDTTYSGSGFFSFFGFFGSMVSSGSIWIIVGIAVALAAAAVITVIVVKKRKKTAG